MEREAIIRCAAQWGALIKVEDLSHNPHNRLARSTWSCLRRNGFQLTVAGATRTAQL